jgi:hypothetical protein
MFAEVFNRVRGGLLLHGHCLPVIALRPHGARCHRIGNDNPYD